MNLNISIIIPVLDEAAIINRIIDSIYGIPYQYFEVIVADGSPYGETINAIKRVEVKKVISVKGRPQQMNEGAAHAGGDILLFLHADTLLPNGAMQNISSVMEKGDFVGGAFDLGILSDRPVFRVIETVASLRSRVTKIPYGDQAIFIRKDYFHQIGGFGDMPIMEEVDLMQKIKRRGDRIFIIPDKVRTSPRRWEKEGVLYCTLRNWTLMTLYLLGFPAEKLVKFYKF